MKLCPPPLKLKTHCWRYAVVMIHRAFDKLEAGRRRLTYVEGNCPKCGMPLGEMPDPLPEGWVCFLCKEKDDAEQARMQRILANLRTNARSHQPDDVQLPVTDDTPQLRAIRAEEAIRERIRANEEEAKLRMARFRLQETRRERGLDPGRYHSNFYSKPKVPGAIPTDDAERRQLIDEFKRKNG